MSLEVSQEGRGKIILTTEVPPDLSRHIIKSASPLIILGHMFQCLMQEFKAGRVSGWFNRMWAGERVIICLDAEYAVLELRISLKNRIRGTWDKKTDGTLPEYFFQLCFVPQVITRAIFDRPLEYQTYDTHCTLSYLEDLGVSYKMLDVFIKKVRKNSEAVELAPYPYPCSDEMIQLIRIILRSQHQSGHSRMIENHHESLLIAALEVVTNAEGIKHVITKAEDEALYDVKSLIELSFPEYLSNTQLLAKVYPRLNGFKLSYGFKKKFGIGTHEFYQRLRFKKAQQLLEQGVRVEAVADAIGYEWPNAFIREFKARFGVTPKQWGK